MCGNKKISLGAKCGGWPIISTFWDDLREFSHCHCEQWFVFSCSYFKFLQRNCGVPLRIDRAMLLKWNSRRRPFVSKCFFHKQLSLDLTCLRRSTWWTVYHLWRACKRLLKHRHRIFPIFLCTNRQEPFLSDSARKTGILRPGVHAISNVCWWEKTAQG